MEQMIYGPFNILDYFPRMHLDSAILELYVRGLFLADFRKDSGVLFSISTHIHNDGPKRKTGLEPRMITAE